MTISYGLSKRIFFPPHNNFISLGFKELKSYCISASNRGDKEV